MKKKQYVIVIANSRDNDPCLLGFVGTKTEVKEKMLQLIEEDRNYNCEYEMDTWEEGAEEIDDIEEMYDSYYAFARYEDCYIAYRATPIKLLFAK